MKKLIYIILATLLLLVAGHLANQHFATEPEIVVEEEITVSSEAEAPVEEIVSEDVVETNPEDTADEGETFVEE